MPKLRVKFHNMCVFAEGETRAEMWFVKCAFHEPFAHLNNRVIGRKKPAQRWPRKPQVLDVLTPEFRPVPDSTGNPRTWEVASRTRTRKRLQPIGGLVASFLSDKGQCGEGATRIDPEYKYLLTHLHQVAPDAKLRGELSHLPLCGLPTQLACRVKLQGGMLKPLKLCTEGGEKRWWLGDQVTMQLSEDAVYELALPADVKQVYLRLAQPDESDHCDFPIRRVNGDFVLIISAEHKGYKNERPAEKKFGYVFLVEISALNKLLTGGDLPTPCAFWPDYDPGILTDPNGGVCEQACVRCTG